MNIPTYIGIFDSVHGWMNNISKKKWIYLYRWRMDLPAAFLFSSSSFSLSNRVVKFGNETSANFER